MKPVTTTETGNASGKLLNLLLTPLPKLTRQVHSTIRLSCIVEFLADLSHATEGEDVSAGIFLCNIRREGCVQLRVGTLDWRVVHKCHLKSQQDALL